mgnify:CR=1 FL=1
MTNKIDKSNMYKDIIELPNHIQDSLENFKNNSNLEEEKYIEIESIMILGMGGSAITGLLVSELLKNKLNIPIYVNQNYSIPKWVNHKTLVIASSYSGNTEETLISCKECLEKTNKIIPLTTGGQLFDLLQKENYFDYVKMPKGLQPRATIGYSFALMLILLNKINIIDDSFIKDLENSVDFLIKKNKEYSKQNKNNIAYSIANKIYNKNPIIYAEEGVFNIISYRFKCQLNENSKIIAFNHAIPEMNHNEIESYSNKINLNENFTIIWINDSIVYDKNKKRIEIVSNILKNKIKNQLFLEINFKDNENKILKYLTYINLVDWISYHCAILNQIDPSIIPNINELKKSL